jgi:hypothetical protein
VERVTVDIVELIRRNLAADREAAEAATPGPWRHNPDKHWRKPGTSWFEEAVFAGPAGDDATCVAGTGETEDPQSHADAAHIARQDPAATLRRVEALERIVELHAVEHKCPTLLDDGVAGDLFTFQVGGRFPCQTLRLIASTWPNAPGYDPAWTVPPL